MRKERYSKIAPPPSLQENVFEAVHQFFAIHWNIGSKKKKIFSASISIGHYEALFGSFLHSGMYSDHNPSEYIRHGLGFLLLQNFERLQGVM